MGLSGHVFAAPAQPAASGPNTAVAASILNMQFMQLSSA
jgi:hypothetical protein